MNGDTFYASESQCRVTDDQVRVRTNMKQCFELELRSYHAGHEQADSLRKLLVVVEIVQSRDQLRWKQYV